MDFPSTSQREDRAFIHTTSSDSDVSPYRRIGAGCCGSVWATEHGLIAHKREDGGPGRSVLNDYRMHIEIIARATDTKLDVCVPRWPAYIPSNNEKWWQRNLPQFPPGLRACNVLSSERIPALAQNVRECLIDLYCPKEYRDTIKQNDADRDCLVRLYLGRRKLVLQQRSDGTRRRTFFSLRNFPLHLNQAEDLGLDVEKYARSMAAALAMVHWVAGIDANDIEFVLGGDPRTGVGRFETDTIFGTHSLWMLDFDCCKSMAMDDEGIEKAARAFLRNDPYYPRPCRDEESQDFGLWKVFRDEFLLCSSEHVRRLGLDGELPRKLIGRIEELSKDTGWRRSPIY